MVAEVMNRGFVLDQLARVQSELDRPASKRRGIGTLSAEASVAVKAVLAEANKNELANSSGQSGYELSPESAGGIAQPETPAPLEDHAFFSHNPGICLLQSALTEYFLTHAPEQLAAAVKPTGRRGGGGADQFQPVGGAILQASQLKAAPGRRLFNSYSQTDPRWVASWMAIAISSLDRPHDFNPKPASPCRMGNKARLILVGDWGSGLPRARSVANHMRAVIAQGREVGLEQHVIHLGDVYYSGWESEYQRNFLPAWPVKPDETGDKLRSWCLNGNHDMYSGGYDYFDFLLGEPRFARQERSSFFSFHNDHWDIFGLDTAHEDAGLRDPQLSWLQEKRQGSSRRSMLLSHHQLFSVYEKPSAPLQEKIGRYLLEQPVDVWFWGHEHRCVFYRESEGVRNARLIGHGGVPVYMNRAENDPYPAPACYQYRAFRQPFLEKWAYFGFAVVDLENNTARVRYIDEFGFVHKEETL